MYRFTTFASMDPVRGDLPADSPSALEEGETSDGVRSGPPSPRTQPPSQATDGRRRRAPAPADGALSRPLRGVPAAAAALPGADGGSARRAPGTAQAAAASGAPAAAHAGAAASSARRGAGGAAQAAAAAAAVARPLLGMPAQPLAQHDEEPAVRRRRLQRRERPAPGVPRLRQERDDDSWDRPVPPGAAGITAAARVAAGRGMGAASRTQNGASGFAAARGAAGGSGLAAAHGADGESDDAA